MNRDVLSPTFEQDNPDYNPDFDYCGPSCISWILRPFFDHDLIPDFPFGICIRRCCYWHDRDWAAGRFRTGNRRFAANIRKVFRAAGKPKLGNRVAWVYNRGVSSITGRLIFAMVVAGERLKRSIRGVPNAAA